MPAFFFTGVLSCRAHFITIVFDSEAIAYDSKGLKVSCVVCQQAEIIDETNKKRLVNCQYGGTANFDSRQK